MLGFATVADTPEIRQVPDLHRADVLSGRYPHVVDYLLSAPWAITPEKLRAIASVVVHRAYAGRLDADAVAAAVASRRPSDTLYATADGFIPAAAIEAAGGRPPDGARNITAVLPVMGTILPRVSAMDESSGMFSLARFRREFASLVADPAISGIVLDFDTPGGSVALVEEAGAEIFAARDRKPIAAVADTLAASAGYWLFAQATPGLQYVTQSGLIGSVGVISAHEDISRALEQMGVTVSLITSRSAPHKAEGNPYEPLGDEARAEMQRLVDAYHADFRSAVARGRGVSEGVVDARFGGGRVLRAAEAVAAGMADRVGTLDDAIRAVMAEASSGAGASARQPRGEHEGTTAGEPAAVDWSAVGARVAAGIITAHKED